MSDPSINVDQAEPIVASMQTIDHGALPPWQIADLPKPLPLSIRNVFHTIGPGAILLAASIGAGEWIAGPVTAVNHGSQIMWLATVSIFLQMLFNLEAVRYTLYTGEPIFTGFMRLNPGSKFWAIFYIGMGLLQLATPALALTTANVIFAASVGREANASESADGTWLMFIAFALVLVTAYLLLSGKSIERMLERISWGMIAFIFVFLLTVNCLFVPAHQWVTTATGFLTPSQLPDNVDLILLATFVATAGSGGLGNLAISNWTRDKGFGMGAYMGGIGGVLSDQHVELARTGKIFPVTAENLARWRQWWRYALIDQSGLWAVGCVVGMYLNVNLALAIIPEGSELAGTKAGAFQAQYMAQTMWHGLWFLGLLNGFWILYSTHIGNTDCLTRTISDIAWVAWPKLQRWSSSKVYATILAVIVVIGLVILSFGEDGLGLFKVLGVVANPIMAIGAIQILRVNTRFLPKEIRPPWWRRAGLVLCTLLYGTMCIVSVYSLLR